MSSQRLKLSLPRSWCRCSSPDTFSTMFSMILKLSIYVFVLVSILKNIFCPNLQELSLSSENLLLRTKISFLISFITGMTLSFFCVYFKFSWIFPFNLSSSAWDSLIFVTEHVSWSMCHLCSESSFLAYCSCCFVSWEFELRTMSVRSSCCF